MKLARIYRPRTAKADDIVQIYGRHIPLFDRGYKDLVEEMRAVEREVRTEERDGR